MRGIFLGFALGVALLPLCALANFTFQNVIDLAKERAANPYQPPPEIPKFMRELGFHDYQNIRFDPAKSLWRDNNSQFNVMFLSPGLFYGHPVAMNVIDAQGIHPVPYQKSYFRFEDPELEKRVPPDLGFAGFKLTFPFFEPDIANQFLVFAGASYFRGVGKHNAWGISARGVAINTGLPSGEEFPSFVEFWLERPRPEAKSVTFYGLLDGKSLSGAYRFVVTPGEQTSMQVRAVLFPRGPVALLGVAPLTSMFYYGENTSRPVGEWRGEVHDSDGLLIRDGASAEWLWRPLLNPTNLQMDYFHTENLRGFGLLQRDSHFTHYQDLGARYELRPSAWVEPLGDWGKGQVVLVQLPTPNETNDNVVAFWTPAAKIDKPGQMLFDYRIRFGGPDLVQEPLGRSLNTFVGDGNRVGGGNEEGAYRLIVDFAGGPLQEVSAEAPVVGKVTALEGGELIEQFVEYNEPLQAWRLSILARPAKGRPLSLRAFLSEGERTLTETWTYRLPPENDILPEAK